MTLTGLESSIEKIASRRGAVLIRPAGSGDFRHGGIMTSTGVKIEPIETNEDENGETRQVGAEISLETRLMQTEATTAIDLMQELTSGRIDAILTPNPVSGTTLTNQNAQSIGELIFQDRHLKIGGRLNYDRGESYLPASLGFTISMAEIHTLTLL